MSCEVVKLLLLLYLPTYWYVGCVLDLWFGDEEQRWPLDRCSPNDSNCGSNKHWVFRGASLWASQWSSSTGGSRQQLAMSLSFSGSVLQLLLSCSWGFNSYVSLKARSHYWEFPWKINQASHLAWTVTYFEYHKKSVVGNYQYPSASMHGASMGTYAINASTDRSPCPFFSM